MAAGQRIKGSHTIAAVIGVTLLLGAWQAGRMFGEPDAVTVAAVTIAAAAVLLELPLLIYTRAKENERRRHDELIDELRTTPPPDGPAFAEPSVCWADLAVIDQMAGHRNEQTDELESLIDRGAIQQDQEMPNRYRWRDENDQLVIMTVTPVNPLQRAWTRLRGQAKGPMGQYSLYTSERAATKRPEGTQ